MRIQVLTILLLADFVAPLRAAELTDYFPPPESKGGWRTALPATGEPNAEQKAAIAKLGVDYDKLKEAWEHNAKADGATGMIVIRKGTIVGEWYRGGDKNKAYNIYSSSKAYTSFAYGLLFADSDAGKLAKKITLDTKVCNEEWLPECLPLPDPRKADITVRQLLGMNSGLGVEQPEADAPFESAFGKTEKLPFKKLQADPGEKFFYSNAGVAHLVMVFKKAAGKDLYPYMEERVFDPTGVENLKWTQLGGGKDKLGPLSQGYSGINTTPREHARFCYLAMHKGFWAGKPLVPSSHYDFAWTPTKQNPTYGAQWWLYPKHKDGPKDLMQTAGARNNHGYVVPSLDLIFVRLGDGAKFEKGYEQDLVKKVLAAVK